MANRLIQRQTQALLRHVQDSQGRLDAKLAVAVATAVAKSNISHRRLLLRQFVKDIAAIERRQRVVVISAAAINEVEQTQIETALRRQHPDIVSIDWQRQPNLLAGITTQVGDTWYDISVKQRLLQVQERLG